jgi:hypothetical protein
MAKQTPATKAIAYLTDGKIKIQEHDVVRARILAYGSDNRPYTITFDSAGWVCDCPAQIAECAHVLAAKLISPLRQTQRITSLCTADEDLDDFLAGFKTGVKPSALDEWWENE